MGYYNPIYNFGVQKFLTEVIEAGADGLIVVDLPPEEDEELCIPAKNVTYHSLANRTHHKQRTLDDCVTERQWLYLLRIYNRYNWDQRRSNRTSNARS